MLTTFRSTDTKMLLQVSTKILLYWSFLKLIRNVRNFSNIILSLKFNKTHENISLDITQKPEAILIKTQQQKNIHEINFGRKDVSFILMHF